MLYAIVAVVVLILDQAVKFYTVSNIQPQAIGDACKTLIPGVIHMTNVQNYGAAFSILENNRTLLIVISAVFIIGIIVLINMDIIHTKFGRWTAVLVMAGALGNCIDRVLLGYVVDMFEVELFTFTVFNVADIFITVGGILFCLHVIIYREPEEERNAVPRPEKKRKPSRKKAVEEELPVEAEEVSPATRRAVRGRTKAQAVEAVDEGEKPERPARRRRRQRPGTLTVEDELMALDPDDPFAEWEHQENAAPGPAPEPEPEPEPEPAPEPEPEPAPEPEKPAEDTEDTGFEDYSLDDILAEFRD